MKCVHLSKESLISNLLHVGEYQGVSDGIKWTKPNGIGVREMALPLAHLWLISPGVCAVPLTQLVFRAACEFGSCQCLCPTPHILLLSWSSTARREIVS